MYITEQTITEWQEFLTNRQYSENTKNNYKSDLKSFLKWLLIQNWYTVGDTISSEKIRLIDIEKRKTYLSKIPTPKTSIYYTVRPTISQQTIQTKINAVRSFMKFLNFMYDQWLEYRKIETKKIKSDYIECLTEKEFQIFFNFIGDYEKYKINALRMQLLCNIGYTSWLRLSEMLNLTIKDIKKKEIRIIGKWDKARRVFFTPSTIWLLEDYLIERDKPIPWTWIKEKKSDFTFISHNSWYDYWKPIAKNTVCEIMKKYSDNINLNKRITVHSLRHSYATRLLESWMNIREIQELLWHKDIQTTENYCHVLRWSLKEKVSEIFR
jgi:integrase/recombinase XerD